MDAQASSDNARLDYQLTVSYLLRFFLPFLLLIWGAVAVVVWVEQAFPHSPAETIHIAVLVGVGYTLLLLVFVLPVICSTVPLRGSAIMVPSLMSGDSMEPTPRIVWSAPLVPCVKPVMRAPPSS